MMPILMPDIIYIVMFISLCNKFPFSIYSLIQVLSCLMMLFLIIGGQEPNPILHTQVEVVLIRSLRDISFKYLELILHTKMEVEPKNLLINTSYYLITISIISLHIQVDFNPPILLSNICFKKLNLVLHTQVEVNLKKSLDDIFYKYAKAYSTH